MKLRGKLQETNSQHFGIFMTQKNQSSEQRKSVPAQSAGKKPYSKPEFRYERVFETLALACQKLDPGLCRLNQKSS